MQLIFREHKIAFADIRKEKIDSLPVEMQGAARLIADWMVGRELYEIQTSGSTGTPKTIQLTREKIAYSARQTAEAFDLKAGDTLFCCLGMHYIGGFMMVMRALVNNCNLVIEPPASNPLAPVLEELKPDFASFIPMQMETMLRDEKAVRVINNMKAILVGGGPVSAPIEEKMQVLEVPVYHTYAMTETYSHVAVRLLNTKKKSAFFQPMPGVNLSTDHRGCLVVNSYLTDYKQLTTNDIVSLNADGSFEWTGRTDNIINSGGVKIQLEKIETVCQEVFDEMGLKSLFFADGLPDDLLGQRLVLIVEGLEFNDKEREMINYQLSIKLGKYEIPKEIIFVREIFKTSSGKVDRIKTIKEMINNQ